VFSRENAVVAGCVLLAVPTAVAVDAYTAAPTWAWMAVLLAVGVGLPQAVNRALDRRSADGDG
jgi:hypothetical protein